MFQITIKGLELIKSLATIFRHTASETNTDNKSHVNVFLDIQKDLLKLKYNNIYEIY